MNVVPGRLDVGSCQGIVAWAAARRQAGRGDCGRGAGAAFAPAGGPTAWVLAPEERRAKHERLTAEWSRDLDALGAPAEWAAQARRGRFSTPTDIVFSRVMHELMGRVAKGLELLDRRRPRWPPCLSAGDCLGCCLSLHARPPLADLPKQGRAL